MNAVTTDLNASLNTSTGDNTLKEASKSEPCRHCGKPDWCYTIGNLEVCKRHASPVEGWYQTSKADTEGTPYYAPTREQKLIRPKQKRVWEYSARDGSPLVRVVRIDDGEGRKNIYQQHWDGSKWVKGLGDISREDIPVYRYKEIKEALALGQEIFIAEGEPAADALWSIGIPATTNIGGSLKWRESDTADLTGASVVLCPDRDESGMKHMKAIAEFFQGARWLLAYPDSPLWSSLPKSGGLDVADWIADFNLDAMKVRSAVINKSWIDRLERLYQAPPASRPNTLNALAQKVMGIKQRWGKSLRYNELTMDIEFDGKPMEWDTLKVDVAVKLNILMSQEEAQQAVTAIALENRYHPVRDYLEDVAKRYPYNPQKLEGLAKLFFGTDKPIYDVYMKKWLVGAVSRVLTPGSKVDNSLVLHGAQGIMKSTFFREMAAKNEWFLDSVDLNESEKDVLMKLHRSWIVELGEIETLTTKREDAWWKNFSARLEDTFRPPYGRRTKTVQRGFVIVGTTNREEFLNDPTGNRRFWIIPAANKRIDILLVRCLRDELWANAVHALRAGDLQAYLTDEESATLAQENTRFQIEDLWESLIADYIAPRSLVTIPEIATNCLRVDVDKQDKRLQARIADLVRKLGWFKDTRRINGKPVKCWICPKDKLPPLPQNQEEVTSGGNASEPLQNKDLSQNVTTVTTSKSTLKNDCGNLPQENEPKESSPTPNSSGKVNKQVVTPTAAKSSKSLQDKVQEPLPPTVTTFTDDALNALKIGDRVRYVGSLQQYRGQELIVASIEYGKVTCQMANGYFTTWLDPEHLRMLK